MPSVFWTVRRVAIALACAASVALGLALVWRFVAREALERTSTPELLAVLGLLVLPGAAGGAILLERRGAYAPADDPEPTLPARPAGPRWVRNHRRLVHARSRPAPGPDKPVTATAAGSPASPRT